MGQKQPEYTKCVNCRSPECQKCESCLQCYPIQQCQECLSNKIANLKIHPKLSQNVKNLSLMYDSGLIIQTQPFTSIYSSSRIPFSNKIIKHALVQLIIVVPNRFIETIIVDMERNKKGKIQVILSKNSSNKVQITEKFNISNFPFKYFYEYLRSQWHGKQYHRYQRNCFDFALDVTHLLIPNLSYETIKKFNDAKSKTISQFWE